MTYFPALPVQAIISPGKCSVHIMVGVQGLLITNCPVEPPKDLNSEALELGARMAKPLANPWRNRILAELYVRPMSPKRFVLGFSDPQSGGPGLSTVARYFRELEAWGLIEVTQELRGGKRRGAVEKIYRVTTRICFDTPTWSTLPYYLRSECSVSLVHNLYAKIADAVDGDTFDLEKDRHLSWKAIYLDRVAWSQLSARLDQVLTKQDELEKESAHPDVKRIEGPLLATTGLLCFRSPAPSADAAVPVEVVGAGPEEDELGQHFLMRAETAKALANPWRNTILAELNLRPMSPKQFFHEFGGPDLPTTARYFRQLKTWGYLDIAEELRGGRRRGSVEKIYKTVRRVRFSTPSWERLPLKMRSACSLTTLDGLFRRIDQALTGGTFDLETDRFLAWKTGYLTRAAWEEYGKELDRVLDWVDTLEGESARRLASGEGECIPATIGLLAFRSPDEAQNA